MAIELIEGSGFVQQLRAYADVLQKTIPDVRDSDSAKRAAVICIAVMAIHEKASELHRLFKRAERKREILRTPKPFDAAELQPFRLWVPKAWGLS